MTLSPMVYKCSCGAMLLQSGAVRATLVSLVIQPVLAHWTATISSQPLIDASAMVAMETWQCLHFLRGLELLEAYHALVVVPRGIGHLCCRQAVCRQFVDDIL